MTLAPRAVLVHRRTDYQDLLARHGSRGQAAFFLAGRDRSLDELEDRHHRTLAALARAAGAVPAGWRHSRVERDDLDRFLFGPQDVVVVVGQDGLVANVAKYLSGQPVIGIDPDPGRNAGVLVRHRPGDAAELLHAATAARAGAAGTVPLTEHTMVEAVADDTQRLLALNEIYIGQRTHQTARYRLAAPGGSAEDQASSGVLVCTGTGATGWCRSTWLERRSTLRLPEPTAPALGWFVREAWPSPVTGTSQVQGVLDTAEQLSLTVESDQLVAFGDGMESDALQLSRGQTVRLRVAGERLRLLA
ncbi:NAD(+)/NADH kinase [Kitasatospora viridis]|uniref:ATP-NAD kinase n=1 Tax=Kitasatospora viridis TaxID=281105 RepID=A0A561TTI6_9ACTN|nr:NAD(+)/NADH kinase [Kitasatospora viridis]TWF90413.1 ATP-NAD kinase [Kitasatospora viridis]